MQGAHDHTVVTLLTDKLPQAASQGYIKDRSTHQVPREQQKGRSFDAVVTDGGYPKVSGWWGEC